MFKLGDRVRCVDDNHSFNQFRVGEEFKVLKVSQPNPAGITYVWLEGIQFNPWLSGRFELVEDYYEYV